MLRRHLPVILLVGSALIGLGAPFAAPVVIGKIFRLHNLAFASFPAASATNAGGLLYDTTNSTVRVSTGSAWNVIATPPVETKDTIPYPANIPFGEGTVVPGTTLNGCMVTIPMDTTFTQIYTTITAFTGAPTMKMLVYQSPGGTQGVASLKATVAAKAVTATGVLISTPAEGTVALSAGYAYVLFGRDSVADSFTIRTWGFISGMDLYNRSVLSTWFKTGFTTVTSATTTPTTFDPPTATDSTAATCPILRFASP